MNTNTTIEHIMNKKPMTLSSDMSVVSAVDLLLATQIPVAPVCNRDNELVGIFSVHDVMQSLWCQNYLPENHQVVADLMTSDVVTMEASKRLVDIAEYFSIDKEQLYQVTGAGIATQLSTLGVEERLQNIRVNRPHLLPVMNQGQFVGTVSRLDVLKALRPVYGPEPAERLDKIA